MCETARDLLTKTEALTCPVIFTGAIWPLANGPKSDGWDNLSRAALHRSDDLPPYVYIAMGDLFAKALGVHKDFQQLKFVDHSPPIPG
jgi:L-asparaginase/Glu-tRNA(Gln) amidotransferase subunit D